MNDPKLVDIVVGGVRVDSDVSLSDHDRQVRWRWRRVGGNINGEWVRVRRQRRSRWPGWLRMQTLVSCEICHSGSVLQTDTYGGPPLPRQKFCADCLRIYLDASPFYQYDELPLIDAQEYQTDSRGEATGEQRLAAALIHNAAADIWKDGGLVASRNRTGNRYYGSAKERLDAFRWIYGDLQGGISFAACCTMLGWHPDAMRRFIFLAGERLQQPQAMKRRFTGNHLDDPMVDPDVPVLCAPFSDRSAGLIRIKKVTVSSNGTAAKIEPLNIPDDVRIYIERMEQSE